MKLAKSRGFTTVELLVFVLISGILALILGRFYINQLTGSIRNWTLANTQSSTMRAADVLARQIRKAQAVEATNSITDDNQPDGWTSGADTLVLAIPALDANDDPIYTDSSHNAVYSNNMIIYTLSNVIYRRMLANSTAPGNALVTTCPPSQATAECPTDPTLVEEVATLTIDYGGVSPAQARSVVLTLAQRGLGSAEDFLTSVSVRTTLRNR